MAEIKGKVREQSEEFAKKIGMVEVTVVAINPTKEEYNTILGMTLKDESKAAEYLGESKDGNSYVRVDFWLQGTDNPQKFKVSFFIEDKNRENKDGTKYQYINNIGICSWGEDDSNLPSWFAKRDYRQAKSGEEDFYSFLRSWLGGLDYSDSDTELQLDWKKLIKGNVNMLRELIDSEYAVPFLGMATVAVKEAEDGTITEFQGIYNKGFLPSYSMRHFNLTDYSDPAVLAKLDAKASKDLKIHERFIKNVIGEYGCKDIYALKPLSDYNSAEHLVGSSASVGGDGTYEEAEDDSEY